MERVTIDYAREHLDELIERAAKGEDVQIADPRHGTLRLSQMTAQEPREPVVRPGRWKGRIAPPPEDFFDPASEQELALWYGEPP